MLLYSGAWPYGPKKSKSAKSHFCSFALLPSYPYGTSTGWPLRNMAVTPPGATLLSAGMVLV